MVQLTKRLYTFEEYLEYDDGTDKRYELVDGELVEIPQHTGRHARIARFLYDSFRDEIRRLSLPWVSCWDIGVRTAERKSRIPDLVIITEEQEQAILDVSAVIQTTPLLVVEIVSENYATNDYRYKRSEYAVREIPEYWIVDYYESKITVLLLVEGFYDEQIFTGEDRIVSLTFPELNITVNEVLA
ncbi:MAG: Uma2 family endonuclease [Gomphosphaeria aponina SAG 52.96 = DSM 107014]|uniref:Uma2 family endonuclease n=1 Tax=Gomphosphaeria aponina SAG 52.96 = DSM 107014 TaxID=1521640 RepID=A0A941GWK3_9CHRO|nr:Uma2 family endonuclease [Gomphosphaeria aponina SAG 52.96 = DSM 107014]